MARSCAAAMQETHACRQFPVRAAPLGHPVVDAEKVKVASRKVHTNLRQAAVLDWVQSVLRYPERERHITNPACATRSAAPRTKRMPPSRVLAVGQVRLDARKRRHKRAPDLAIHHANLGRREEGTRVFGQLLLESHER